MSDLSDFKRFATVAEVTSTLIHLIKEGQITGDEIFLTSRDPEGNGYVGYEPQDVMDAGIAGNIVPERLGFRVIFADVDAAKDRPGTAVILMPTFEVDPEF